MAEFLYCNFFVRGAPNDEIDLCSDPYKLVALLLV